MISKCRQPNFSFSSRMSPTIFSARANPVGLLRDVVDVRDVAELAPVEVAALADQDGQDRRRGEVIPQRQPLEIGGRERIEVLDQGRTAAHHASLREEEVGHLGEVPPARQLRDELENGRLALVDDHPIGEVLEERRQPRELVGELREHGAAEDDEEAPPTEAAGEGQSGQHLLAVRNGDADEVGPLAIQSRGRSRPASTPRKGSSAGRPVAAMRSASRCGSMPSTSYRMG